MSPRRLLAICWDMPPLSGPRAVQVSRTVRHLAAHGWHSTVVCFAARSSRYNQDVELARALDPGPGVTLERVPSPEEWLIFRTLWRVCPPVKLLPDEKWVWTGRATRAALNRHSERPFDVVVSFAQPWSDHRIGLRVHRATGLPWVAHFSDPWTDSPYLRGRAWQRKIWARMEAEVVREANALVFVNEQTRVRVMEKYPHEWRGKSWVVPHGYEPRQDVPPATGSRPYLNLVYTGRFYEGLRSPASLLRAVAALGRRRSLGDQLRLVFVGTPVPSDERLAERLGLASVVSFMGRQPFAESTRAAMEADVLVVIDAPAAESLFLPSKLIEYLPLRKPILGLTPSRGPSADLIRALGYPVVDPDDEGAIERALENLLDAKRSGLLGPSADHDAVAAEYDVRRTTAAFAEILERCA
jgi:glycosyltransferase involved in cell wall biosynthesis